MQRVTNMTILRIVYSLNVAVCVGFSTPPYLASLKSRGSRLSRTTYVNAVDTVATMLDLEIILRRH